MYSQYCHSSADIQTNTWPLMSAGPFMPLTHQRPFCGFHVGQISQWRGATRNRYLVRAAKNNRCLVVAQQTQIHFLQICL